VVVAGSSPTPTVTTAATGATVGTTPAARPAVTAAGSAAGVTAPTPTTPAVVTAGQAGPRGLPGPAGTEVVRAVAGEALSALRVVYADPTDGRVYYADKGTAAHGGRVLGLTLAAAAAGDEVAVQTQGRAQDAGWDWDTAAAPGLFLGSAGAITQGAPATGFVLRVGFVKAADEAFIRIDPPIYLE